MLHGSKGRKILRSVHGIWTGMAKMQTFQRTGRDWFLTIWYFWFCPLGKIHNKCTACRTFLLLTSQDTFLNVDTRRKEPFFITETYVMKMTHVAPSICSPCFVGEFAPRLSVIWKAREQSTCQQWKLCWWDGFKQDRFLWERRRVK